MSPPGDLLIPEYPGSPSPPRLIQGPALADFRQYLSDESRRTGRADLLVFPRSTGEVSAAVQLAASRDAKVTVSGARTGITAGAVPEGGMLLSLERLNRVRGLRKTEAGELRVVCEAGVVLGNLQRALETGRFTEAAEWDETSQCLLSEVTAGRYFYPPDPTETSASIGGTVACNASGAHTFRYGPTRTWVSGLEVVLADGGILRLERGRHRATPDGTFRLRRRDGRDVTVHLPALPQPDTKNAAGYFSRPGMDLVDLFIGSEGTLGIITCAELRLAPSPECRCLVAVFFEHEARALRFTAAVRDRRNRIGVEAIEYMDARALDFLRSERERKGAASHVPEHLPAEARGVIFLDLAARDREMTANIEATAAEVKRFGSDPERCWVATGHAERETLRLFRHALPESVNHRVAELRREHPGLTKLGTDMAVPDDCLERTIRLYRNELDAAGLDYVIFGHIGDNHLHVNILPATPEEYALGKQLYLDFAREVVAMGGSPAAEHGIGKLKTAFLELLVGPQGLAGMKAVKQALDPDFRLGPGTLFAPGQPQTDGSRTASSAHRRRTRRSRPMPGALRRDVSGPRPDGGRPFRMAVCIKQVPNTADLRIDPETNTLIRDGVESIFNPLDEFALEAALRLREQTGGSVTAFTMGPPQSEAVLRKAVAMGADRGVLVSDRKFAGADTWATSKTLAAALAHDGPFDLIFCGKQAIDGDTAQVGPGIAAHLGIAQATYVTAIEPAAGGRVRLERLLDDGVTELDIGPPALLSVLKEANEPRLPSLAGSVRARRTEFGRVDAETLGLARHDVGLEGSPTRVVKIEVPRIDRGHVRLEGDPERIATELLSFLRVRGLNGDRSGSP